MVEITQLHGLPHSADIFRQLTLTLYFSENKIPKDTKDYISQGIRFILEFGQILFNRAGLQRIYLSPIKIIL